MTTTNTSAISGTTALAATPSFIAAAMAEHGKPTTPPIVPPRIKSADPVEALVVADEARSATETPPVPAVILAAHDEGGKPHASWFTATERLQAIDATRGTTMLAIDIDTDDLQAIAMQLPRGKIHASGKAFVPFAKLALFNELSALHPALAQKDRSWTLPRNVTSDMMNKVHKAKVATDREAMTVGNIVLAKTPGVDDDSWYIAVIVEESADGVCTLVWRDYIEDGLVSRHRDTLALLPPVMPEEAAA